MLIFARVVMKPHLFEVFEILAVHSKPVGKIVQNSTMGLPHLGFLYHKGKQRAYHLDKREVKGKQKWQSKMANCQWLWTIVWFFALLIIWPIGFLCAIIYELVVPFCACCNGCSDVRNFFQKGLDLPYTASRNMVQGKSLF